MQNPGSPGDGIAGALRVSYGSGTGALHSDPVPGNQPSLRAYQRDYIARVETEKAAGRRRILLVAQTGAGKTVIAAAIIAQAVQHHKRVLFLAHRRELIRQTSRKLYDLDCDHGILLPGYPTRLHEPVQVASVATLHARAVRSNVIELPPADLVFVDEAHHVRARTYVRILEAYPSAIVIGLTATPCRGDGRGLGTVFEVLIECVSVQELIDAGYLVPTKVYAPSRPDLQGVRVERGDYVEAQLAQRMNTDRLVGDVVEHWLRLGERRQTVVFATGAAHSLHIRDEFRRAGVLAEHIDGTTAIEERDAILARLAAGKIEVISNAMVLTEGWDQPAASCLVLARPTKSLGLYRQMVGRVLRPAEGKTDALILDHAGAVFEHGFPEDPIAWTLSEDQRATNKAHAARGAWSGSTLATCPECSAVRFAGKPCPACGWHPVRRAEAVQVVDGELGRVGRDRSVRRDEWTPQAKAEFHRQLLYIARERGYKPGWAAQKHKEKFGHWPSSPPWAPPQPELPSPEVRAWVRSRQIAYAKAMQAQQGAR
jgi:DNA repair protein RadD